MSVSLRRTSLLVIDLLRARSVFSPLSNRRDMISKLDDICVVTNVYETLTRLKIAIMKMLVGN